MQRTAICAALFFCSGMSARAQQAPRVELSAGYSYLREGFTGGVNAQGGSFSVAGNFNNWAGFVGDFGVYHSKPFSANLNTYTYLIGPRFSYRGSSRVTPFVQLLAGGAHFTAGVRGFSTTANGFAYGTGGGLDLGVSKNVAIRPQVDFIGIRSMGSTLKTARASMSIVFRFGGR